MAKKKVACQIKELTKDFYSLEDFQEFERRYGEKFSNIQLVIERDGSLPAYLYLEGLRWETDQEEFDRENFQQLEAKRQREWEAKRKEERRAEYERLKKEFENG